MELKEKKAQIKSKPPISSVIMYSIGTLIALIAIASLVNNVRLFNDAVAQGVAQGYPVAEVNKILIAQQLLPGLFQSIALYGGVAVIFIFAGIMNNKLSKCLNALNKEEARDNIVETIEESEVVEETTAVVDECTKSQEN